MLERFDQLAREKLGVALGEVRLLALPLDAGVLVDSAAAQRALVAAHSVNASGGRPINVVVVRSLGDAGVAPGLVPFAPGIYGQPSSGVVLAPHLSGPAATGVVLMHEVSHALGLFHTSGTPEADLISDTPMCANVLDGGCPDERNLMFPNFKTADPLVLTKGQAQVLEASPWVHRPLLPGACGDLDVVGLSGAAPWAAGTTVGGSSTNVGACGGAGPERLHFFRLEGSVRKLEARVKGTGFSPVVYARRSDCDTVERACGAADEIGRASCRERVS
jgi:hypothetical protein